MTNVQDLKGVTEGVDVRDVAGIGGLKIWKNCN